MENKPNFCPKNSKCPYYDTDCTGTEWIGEFCKWLNDYSNRSGFCSEGFDGEECLVGLFSYNDRKFTGGEREAEVHLTNCKVVKKFRFCPICGKFLACFWQTFSDDFQIDNSKRQMDKCVAFTKDDVRAYLDNAIKSWRHKKDNDPDKNIRNIAIYYIDTFQSVRVSLFGEILPTE